MYPLVRCAVLMLIVGEYCIAFQQIHISKRSIQKAARHHSLALSRNGSEFTLIGDKADEQDGNDYMKGMVAIGKRFFASTAVHLLNVYSSMLQLLIGSFIALDLVKLLVTVGETEEKIPMYMLARKWMANFTYLDLVPLFAILCGSATTSDEAYWNVVYKWVWMWYDLGGNRTTELTCLALVYIPVGAALLSMFRMVKSIGKS